MKIHQNLAALAGVVAALTIATQARADSVNFYLNQGACSGSGCSIVPALIANSSAVDVIVTTTTAGLGGYIGATVEFVAPSGNIATPVYINVKNGGSASNVSATVDIPGGVVGPGGFDLFGTMNLGTSANTASTITFTLAALNGLFWTDAANVLTNTTNFAASYGHGFMAELAGPNQRAPFAGTLSAVPLPAALPLFATALGGLGLLRRRRNRKGKAVS